MDDLRGTSLVGRTLAHYRISAVIGAGGMGEVYRARDTKLDREVALKVLPAEFAADAERMGRFEREAKVLASLNHPNIASIYGLEDSGGAGSRTFGTARALVMELVEGQTLAEKISGVGAAPAVASAQGTRAGARPALTKEQAIPIDEALPIAKQICEGLEYAHERGIVHRDLKPANIKITPDGVVKILDFGLAKALAGETAAADPSTSPTLSHLATQAGIILGTAAYMAPEQAKGKPVDRRADIWAFGCVLYEMLAGHPVFDGETVTDILAAVVTREPDWSALPATTPKRVRVLLQRCLQRDPKRRLQAAGEARIVLEEVQTNAGVEESGSAAAPPDAAFAQPAAWRRFGPWGVAILFAISAVLLAWNQLGRAPSATRRIVAQIPPPEGGSFALSGGAAQPAVISPNGRELAFIAVGADGKRQLWVRPLGSPTAQPLAGTNDAEFPFWSPDSNSIAFFAHGQLERMSASGGPPLVIAAAPLGRGGSWGTDGTILFTPNPAGPILRVPASGGTPNPVTKLDLAKNQASERWAQFLPDGKHFLYYGFSYSALKEGRGTFVGSLDGGAAKFLLAGNSNAIYVPPGYLVYIRQGALVAQRFNAATLRLAGPAMPLAGHVEVNRPLMLGLFGVSSNGILAYRAGDSHGEIAKLLWFDRSGKQIGETGAPGDYSAPSLSPDGRKLAVEQITPGATGGHDIWVYDLARGVGTRLTFSASVNDEPAWSPDGTTIAFASDRSGLVHLYEKAATGTGKASPLVVDDGMEIHPGFSSDGRYLAYERRAVQLDSPTEIWAKPLFGDRKAFPLVQGSQFVTGAPALSPDGKWLAYESDESGRAEIYVVPFPRGPGKWRISTDGGNSPRWRPDGGELFYLSPDDEIMSVKISQRGARLAIGQATPLFQVAAGSPVRYGWSYDVSANGKRFVVVSQVAQKSNQPFMLVVNWPSLLK